MSWLEKLLPPKIQQTDPSERRTIPEGLWELFLGIYCSIWGFRREAPILSEGNR